ncbi:methionine ABC transporter ATP-binding protein [Benzoatithermus flavus]|uniref:Methionine ABC transporter ATP-binding protein n=1 Tax=Benzoatithermus flavus TaxID=3108223 RepID=A0ABU8XVQ0_9PROT
MIQLSGIEKTFSGKRPGETLRVLAGIDLEIAQGEIFGIIGRSGAGKSTLLRTINLLERPTRGRVVVEGVDLTALDPRGLETARRSIGMVFQHFNLLSSRTVLGNVALPLELQGRRRQEILAEVMPLLELVGLADKRDAYPATLSGGQKQRVGIARGLASRPRVLLLDEVTSALDPETTRQILALLADINRRLGLTMVLITHEMAVIRALCDRVAVIEAGRIVEQGDVAELFTTPRHPVTRSFVEAELGLELPTDLTLRLVEGPAAEGADALLRVTFRGPAANEPVIARIAREAGTDLNIVFARVEHVRERPVGVMVVEVAGGPEVRDRVVARLRSLGLGVEVKGHVVPAH